MGSKVKRKRPKTGSLCLFVTMNVMCLVSNVFLLAVLLIAEVDYKMEFHLRVLGDEGMRPLFYVYYTLVIVITVIGIFGISIGCVKKKKAMTAHIALSITFLLGQHWLIFSKTRFDFLHSRIFYCCFSAFCDCLGLDCREFYIP